MTKIEQIEDAIEKALRRESKLTDEVLMVPALSSLNIRHLMNNLGAISFNYLEIGVHKGGLFCSTIFRNDNLKLASAIDSWESDSANEDKAYPQFCDNANKYKPQRTPLVIAQSDSFAPVPENYDRPIADLYLYDADHSEDAQCKAVTHFLPAMADEFILCVDDFDWDEVRNGTKKGVMESGVEILYSRIFEGNDHDNEGWWNGYAVFLLKKKA